MILVTLESVLLRVFFNVVLLEGMHQKFHDSLEFTVRNGLSTIDFDSKSLTSIKELRRYNVRPKSSRYRNIWDMSNGFRSWACKSALSYKDCESKPFIYNPFEEGSTSVYRIDGKHETIAYKCPTVPPLYLEGRVDTNTNRARLTILTDNHSLSASPTSEDRYYESSGTLSSSSSTPSSPLSTSFSGIRPSQYASGYSSTSSRSPSPPSSPYAPQGARYSPPASGSASPWSQPVPVPKYRDASYKSGYSSASRYREASPRPASPSSSSSTPRYSSNPGYRYSPPPSPPQSQPIKRSFGLGHFIMRLVV